MGSGEIGTGADDFPLRHRTIVCLSSIDWDFLWQGHQEIMSRFASMGNRVIFVENTGVRTVRLSDVRRVLTRLAHWFAETAAGSRVPVAGVSVVAPLLLPFPRSRLATAVNHHLLLPRLASRIRALAGEDPILFSYLPTRNAVRLIELLRGRGSVVVYYCVADFRELSDQGDALTDSEVALARSADLIFVQGAVLGRRLAHLNARIHELPAGVNLEVFDVSVTHEVPAELRALPRPIVGYTGGLHRHVDYALLARLARSLADGSVVLVGPLQVDPGPLRPGRNVHFIGARALTDLPSFVASFDVGLVPYVRSAYTDTVYPQKLFEYLAMGRPVVATDLPEVRKLNLPSFAVRVAPDGDAFIAAVHDALSDTRPGAAEERQRFARERDWRTVVKQMATLMAASPATHVKSL